LLTIWAATPDDRWWPDSDRSPSGKSVCSSDPRLFGHLKSLVDLNAEISNCAFKFGMAK
jgi:hypothetical protein